MYLSPKTSLAMSMAAQKGIYTVLLGSGISRASMIPTGWDMVLDMIRKVALSEGEDCGRDPESWFKQKFGENPGYSTLLSRLAPTQAARMLLLRGYFEPNEDERSRGEKQPSSAHRAIAKLVASGHIRVILTTNFDRLMEQAVQDEGVSPTVISTSSQAEGALPFHHTPCTIIKLHGDYLDTRIKNTVQELAVYEQMMQVLLERVLDEHGLIICGWSAAWDQALRGGLEARKGRRFPSYWVDFRPLGGLSADLSNHLGAAFVESTADRFFTELVESVSTLVDGARQHPVTTEIAVGRLKNYIANPLDRIRLHDLMHNETQRVRCEIQDNKLYPPHPPNYSGEVYLHIADSYVRRLGPLLAMAAHGARWGEREHHPMWSEAMISMLEDDHEGGGLLPVLDLRRLPGLLLLYSLGVGTLLSTSPARYELLTHLLRHLKVRRRSGSQKTGVLDLVMPFQVLYPDQLRASSEFEGKRYPTSRFLLSRLQPVLRPMYRSDAAFVDSFDDWEMLLAMTSFEEYGTFLGRFAEDGGWQTPAACLKVKSEMENMGDAWGPIASGMLPKKNAWEALAEIIDASWKRR